MAVWSLSANHPCTSGRLGRRAVDRRPGCALERLGDFGECLDGRLLPFGWPSGGQRVELRFERLDEALGESLSVRGQLDDGHAPVGLPATAIDQPTGGGAVDEPADVGAI